MYGGWILAIVVGVVCGNYDTKSGFKAWVDVDTPEEAYTTRTSRDETWNLVMSDEFNVPGRDFTAGKVNRHFEVELRVHLVFRIIYGPPSICPMVSIVHSSIIRPR